MDTFLAWTALVAAGGMPPALLALGLVYLDVATPWIVAHTSITLAGALIVLEIVQLMRQAPHRPSAGLTAAATGLRAGLRWFYGRLLLLANIGSFLRTLVHMLRDLFFRFVPREIIEQALRDLGAAFKAVFRAPWGAVEGAWDAMRQLTVVGWLVLIVVNVAAPVVLELAFMVSGVSWRLTPYYWATATWLYDACWEMAYAPYYLWHVKDLVVRLGAVLFRSLPIEVVRNVTSSVYAGLGAVVTAPVQGFIAGLWALLPTDNPILMAALPWLGRLVFAAMAVLGLYMLSHSGPWRALVAFLDGSASNAMERAAAHPMHPPAPAAPEPRARARARSVVAGDPARHRD